MMNARATNAPHDLLLLSAALLICACAKPPPPPPPAPPSDPADLVDTGPPEPEVVDTNKACIKAKSVCDGGACTVELTNACDTPVTCELSIVALCKGNTTTGQARGKARDTVRVNDSTTMEAVANCEGAYPSSTLVDTLSCR